MLSFRNYTTLISFLLLLGSCVGTRYLEDNEKLLYRQRVSAADKINSEALDELYVQEANRQIPIIPFSPYVWFYQIGLKKYDPEQYREDIEEVKSKFNKKIKASENEKKAKKLQARKLRKVQRIERKIEEGNVLMRWGEPLARYDSASTLQTVENMELYLQSKGYFKGEVTPEIKLYGKKRVHINYKVKEGPPYIIDTTFLRTSDNAIIRLLRKNKKESLLKVGLNYDQEILAAERERLTTLLKNNGYYAFSKNYIDFDIDTAFNKSQRVAIRTSISTPVGQSSHPIYRLDSVNFIADADLTSSPGTIRVAERYKGITFRAFDMPYNPKVLSRRIFIRSDSLYNRDATLNTQRQLANLDNFKFINVTYDSADGNFIANILVSPLSRYQWSNEFGVNVTQGFPGPFYNLSFKKRNIFGGLENLDITARVGIEGVAPASKVDDDFYKSTEAGVNASLTFPQFILPIGSRKKEELGQINPKTRFTGGYSYTNRPEYNRENTNFSTTYSWESGRNIIYSLTAAELSLINSNLDSAFRERLVSIRRNTGNNLINSFNPSFVSSMKFSVTANDNDYGLGMKNSSFFRFYFESGGTSLNFINKSIFDENLETGRNKLEYYQFIKFSADYRKLSPVNNISSFAYRINAGIAAPYSDNEILPYEKYFFAGGSNGIRAWRPRRLGPGSYTQLDTTGTTPLVSYDFEQQGEILIEGSIEWRQNLIGFIEYAWFLDFGNIWTIRNDASREGAQFEVERFWKEIAIGSGLGIRFDFSFLILRLDAGVKVYDPSRPEGKRFIWSDGYYDAPFIRSEAETLVFNIGIGYPF